MKFSKLSDIRLAKIIDSALDEQNKRKVKRENRAKLQNAAHKLLKEHGVSFEEVFGLMKAPKKVAPKFVHKEDKSLTWSGRGRQPKWIKKFGVKI